MINFARKIMDAPEGKTYLFSVGQAGFIIKSKKGNLLAIDLYLSDYVERIEGVMGVKRMLPKILKPEDIAFDVVIATHPHADHFDYDAMTGLMTSDRTQLLASLECEKLVDELGLHNKKVSYVKPGDFIETGDFKIWFVDCDHGEGAPDAVGVIVEVDGKRIYEVGDSCLRMDRVEQIKGMGPFDVMLAPINGAYGNLNEEDCVKLMGAVKPRLAIPCHYGMFASHGGNPGKFMEAMKRDFPNQEILIMCQGEVLVV